MLLVGLLEISTLLCHASRWLWRAATARTICASSTASNWYLKPTGASSRRGLCGTTCESVIFTGTLQPPLVSLTILYAKRPPALGGIRLYCGRFLLTWIVSGVNRSSSYRYLHRPVVESRHGASSPHTCVMCCSTACQSTESHMHSSLGAAPEQESERASERKGTTRTARGSGSRRTAAAVLSRLRVAAAAARLEARARLHVAARRARRQARADVLVVLLGRARPVLEADDHVHVRLRSKHARLRQGGWEASSLGGEWRTLPRFWYSIT